MTRRSILYIAIFLITLLFPVSIYAAPPAGSTKEKPVAKSTPKPPMAATPAPVKTPVPAATATPSPSTSPAEAKPAQTPSPSPSPEDEERQMRITAIAVEGNQLVPTEEVLKVISLKVGDPLLEPKLRRDVQAIYDTGYFTDVKVDTQYYATGVKIVYKVLENPVTKQIVIKGNKIVPTDKIRSLMETAEGKILNMRTLYADIDEINKYYDETLGYLMKPSHVTDLSTEGGVLTLTVQDGVVVKEVKMTGNTVYKDQDLRKLLKTSVGQLFNQKTLRDDYSSIAKQYEDKDYILDTIRGNIDQQGVVTISIIEVKVEGMRVEGNTKTKEYVVLRNVRTKIGEVLKKKKLQKDIERLNNLGYFEKVDVEPEAGTKPGQVILVWKVKEQKTGLATLGLGWTGGGGGALQPGLTGAISLSERNLKGKGQSASFQWQRGVNIDVVSFSYFDPAFNKKQDSIGFSVYNSTISGLQQPVQGTDPVQYALYNNHVGGASVTYGKLLTEDWRAYLTVKREKIDNSVNSNSAFVPIGLGSGSLNAIGLAALYDTRDDVFKPYSGAFINGSVMKAGGSILKGSFDYSKYVLEIRKYIPFKKQKTLALRAWGGWVSGFGPVTENFYVGGTDTIRGYTENSFFGTRMVVLNAEFRFPIGKIKLLEGAVFADAGNAWFSGQSAFLHKDVGAGLRLVVPSLGLGTIRLDYAVGSQGAKTTLGIGQTF
ncbi:MAG: BamA/TamA family outer membrane protein [Firmicutes bacterium]|nr:BamA/TamA family outer membrane protein [Bacillota bacterium]